MTTHIIIQDNLSAIDTLAAAFGSRLEKLDDRHKLFIMSVLALYLYGSYSMEGAIDELDPDVKLPTRLTDLVEPLQQHSRHDLLLVASIANQIAWGEVMQPVSYYIQTPAIDRLMAEYGAYLEVMSSSDRLSFQRQVAETLDMGEVFEPDGTDNAIEALYLVIDEAADTLTSLIVAIASIQLENAANERRRLRQTDSGEAPF